MTRSRDIDHLLDRWMDDGPTVVADRVIAAALTEIPTTRQRGARWAPMKELFMTMKPAAMMVGLAAVIIMGIAAYQFVSGGGPSIGGPPVRVLTADDLPTIVLGPTDAPTGMDYDATETGADVLLMPIVRGDPNVEQIRNQPGFVDARASEFSDPTSGVLSWAAIFETVEDAERSLALYVDEVMAEEGHGLGPGVPAGFGDEGSYYGGEPSDATQVYLWRVGSLVLATATFGEFDPDELRSIAEGMDDRAH